ncbi:S8 family serine peptidase [Viridibacillus sp. YIM B01967]|uniref:S8 family serine peptidase n=1 Tax=Viridibacillus soli TaxID=2798301 RepID=A0ABS1H8L6_9BACL|nr:S8 family serine peptidase [Viridibacillus soli]MBK3495759.1 S8 family serine peptidase [Viridibacillus soli]
MNLITKKVVAVGASFALSFSLLSSLKVEANTKSVVTKLHSITSDYKMSKVEKRANYSDDTIIIKYSSPLSASDHRKAGGTVVNQISGLKYVAIKVNNKKKLQQTIQNYQKNSKVISVGLSPKYTPTGTIDPKISEQYMHSLLKTANAQKLAGKNQVKVAIIDTGIDRTHPELKESILSSTDITDPMNPMTADSHGTHVAGIIAAKKDNGIGGYGLNPNVKILSYNVFNDFLGMSFALDYTIASAILKAVDQGADVINMSLGGKIPSSVVEAAVEKAISKGVVVVAAAGNGGSDIPEYPAKYEGVISVGSVNNEKKLSDFSSYGISTDVVAPGEDVYAPYYDAQKGSTFANLSGTSMASPVVAGTVALLLSKYPNLKPAEVEYILETTAKDLGAKGFDHKYGNGLIDPVAAMKFDVKKIPSLVKETWGEKEILKNAEQISNPAQVKHSLTKPSEQKWVKLPVEKGEYIQTSLVGAAQYDYKMSIHFYGNGQKQLTDVNDVTEGKIEGKLIQAPFSGTVAIGVKDVNGNFDISGQKQSNFTLQVDKLSKVPEDESILEKPIKIEQWPFNQEKLYMTGEDGDEDYFHFTSKEAQFMKFEVTGIPGVDISASVYEKEQLFPTSPGAELPTNDMAALYTSNMHGFGEGETLSFQTEPEKEYYLKVTNKSSLLDGNILQLLFSLMGGIKESKPAESALPYSVSLVGKTIPGDEDNYNTMQESPVLDEETQDDSGRIALLESVALPYELGGTIQGYLQNATDEDWFKLDSSNAGIYQFQLPTPTEGIPTVELYEVVKEDDGDGKTQQTLSFSSSNEESIFDESTKNKFFASLKANKTYYLAIKPKFDQIPYDGYKVTSKLLVENPDSDEENDRPEQATKLPSTGVTAIFSKTNDIDTYYFTAKENAIYGAKFSRTPLTSSLKAKYPKELLSPYYGFMEITEDINKNHKIDEKEMEYKSLLIKINEDGTTTGSFAAKKGKSYFVTVTSFVESASGLSLWPYQLKVESVNKKDEDANSKVKNNKPSKPIKLQKKSNKLYTSQAYFNSGYENGDEDWFIYEPKKAEQVTLTLDTSKESDGAIEVYRNGKRVAKSDIYGKGDQEILLLKMTKGTYYVKVRDSRGRASIDPYTLSLKVK